MKLRIVKYDNQFAIQYKVLLWWVYEQSVEVDVLGFSHSEVITFSTKEKAREYIRQHYKSNKAVAEVIEYIKI